MRQRILGFAAGLLVTCNNGVHAFWRMNCDVIQTARIDPIVNPGALAAHCHTIVGASNIGVNSTFDTLTNSSCNSCEITPDKSAYWTPNLYYQHGNGTFEEVIHSGSVVYYLGRGYTQDGRQDITPFPPGFQMVSGNKAVRAYNQTGVTWGNATYASSPIANAVTFACLSVVLGPETNNMVNVSTCINGLRAQIHFQTCWDNVNLYKSDNSHVAYLSGIDNGVCPPGYPVLLPHLFIETNYAVSLVEDTSDGGQFVFSMGDPTGYGFHGDFINGWDMDIQTNAVSNCIADTGFGTIEECPILQANRAVEYGANCPPMFDPIDEPVHGLIQKLPGCVIVTPGPGAATAAELNCPAGAVLPSITHTIDSTPIPTANPAIGGSFGNAYEQYIGCGNDSYGSALRTLNAIYYEDANLTIEACQTYCTARGYRYSGVEYQTQCYCDLAINPTAEFYAGLNLTVGCSMTCPGNRSELCGGPNYINVFNNTDPAFVPTNDTSYSAIQLYVPIASYAPNYVGCASNGNAGVALNTTLVQGLNMTTDYCANYCHGLNQKYYALGHGTQCTCGNALAPGSSLLDTLSTPTDSECSEQCYGNYSQVCGSMNNGWSVFQNPDYIPVLITSHVGRYYSKGCLTEAGNGKRALQGATETNANMTVETCVAFCQANYYRYAGVEYANQCYCGNSTDAADGAIAEQCPDDSQLMTCAGNEYEYCGAGNLLNLYYSVEL